MNDSRTYIPGRYAYIWGCDDEVCNCRQVRVQERAPGSIRPFLNVTTVAQGTFFTDGEGEEELRAELEQLAQLHSAEIIR